MNEEKDKKEYELALLLKSEAELPGVMTLVSQHHGEMTSEARAKNLAFAYEINKVKEGVFAYCTFKMQSADAKELELALTSRQDVLRSMIIASPPASEKMAYPMPSRERRGKPMRATTPAPEMKPLAPRPLSNEALEKKIEEILQ